MDKVKKAGNYQCNNTKNELWTGKGIGVAVLDTGAFPHIDFDTRIWCFQDFVNGRIKPYDDNGHGTHVLGIIGGSGAAGKGKIRELLLNVVLSQLKCWIKKEMEVRKKY